MTNLHSGNEGMLRWSLRLLVFSLMAGLQTAHLLPIAMLLLPIATEVLLSAAHDRITPVLISAMSCYVCYLELPDWLRIVCMVWCALPALMAWLPVGNDAARRGAAWCGLSAAMCLALMILLGIRYEGHGFQGVAEAVTAWLSAQPNCKEWLYQLAGSGLLPLKITPAELATMRMFGSWGMSIGVKEQLLSSLTLLMTRWMTLRIPGMMVLLCGVNGVLCAAIPDAIHAVNQGYSDLPPMRRWYIERNWTGPLALLLLPAVLAWLTGESWLGMFAGLCTACFQLAMGVQGLCVLLHLREKHEAGVLMCLLAAMLIAMLPAALVWIGILDQFADFRELRLSLDDDNDDEFY